MPGQGRAARQESDHGPRDHGFVAGRETFMVADSAAVLADPGEGPLSRPAAGQTSSACGLRLAMK